MKLSDFDIARIVHEVQRAWMEAGGLGGLVDFNSLTQAEKNAKKDRVTVGKDPGALTPKEKHDAYVAARLAETNNEPALLNPITESNFNVLPPANRIMPMLEAAVIFACQD